MLPEVLAGWGWSGPSSIGHSDGASIALDPRRARPSRGRPGPDGAARLRGGAFDRRDRGRRRGLRRRPTCATAWAATTTTSTASSGAGTTSGSRLTSGDWNIEDVLPEVDAPVLAIQGDADEYGTLAQLDAIEAGVRGTVRAPGAARATATSCTPATRAAPGRRRRHRSAARCALIGPAGHAVGLLQRCERRPGAGRPCARGGRRRRPSPFGRPSPGGSSWAGISGSTNGNRRHSWTSATSAASWASAVRGERPRKRAQELVVAPAERVEVPGPVQEHLGRDQVAGLGPEDRRAVHQVQSPQHGVGARPRGRRAG